MNEGRLRKPTHPGEVLREDVIIPLGLTMAEAARRVAVGWETMNTGGSTTNQT